MSVRKKINQHRNHIMKFFKKTNKNTLIYIALFILLIYLLPLLVLREGFPVTIHDNLDSFENFYLHIESGNLFLPNDTIIPQKMGGLPRGLLGSELHIKSLIFTIFTPFAGYVFLIISMRILAFFSMFILLKTYVIKTKEVISNIIIVGVSLTFSLLPFYPNFAYGIVAQPLLIYAFLNIRNGKKEFYNWLIIGLFPFFSTLVCADFFIMSILTIVWIYDMFKNKKPNYYFLLALFIMSVFSIVVNCRLFWLTFFTEGYIGHRVEIHTDYLGLKNVIKRMAGHFKNGQYHYHSLHYPFVYLAGILAIVLGIMNKSKKVYSILGLFIFGGLISFLYGIYKWQPVVNIRSKYFLLSAFQFDRYYSLYPVIMYILFAISLYVIFKKLRIGKYVVSIILILQIIRLFAVGSDSQQASGWREVTKITVLKEPYISYKWFVSKNLFREIDEYIGQDKSTYRVVSIGMHPSVSLMNGFYTLDGYSGNYPLEYKHEFRKIIEKELDKNEDLRSSFDNWGSRCYIFVDELGKDFMYTKERDCKIQNLNLNTNQLKKMGGEYIFSAVEIKDYQKNSLEFLKKFTDRNSAWDIFLYKVI